MPAVTFFFFGDDTAVVRSVGGLCYGYGDLEMVSICWRLGTRNSRSFVITTFSLAFRLTYRCTTVHNSFQCTRNKCSRPFFHGTTRNTQGDTPLIDFQACFPRRRGECCSPNAERRVYGKVSTRSSQGRYFRCLRPPGFGKKCLGNSSGRTI